MKRKIIIATIGPTSLNKKVIQKMDQAGVDIFRINLSHTNLNDFEELVLKVQKWTAKPICPDSEGSQLRTGNFQRGIDFVKVVEHDSIELVGCNVEIRDGQIPLSIDSPNQLLQVGDILEIDFDAVIVQVTSLKKEYINARILSGGIIGKNKGIKVDRLLDLPSFTKKDIEIYKISNRLGLSTVFLSFCSGAEDIIKLRKLFKNDIDIISKIESEKGLRNLVEICHESDGILIDRGDLSRDVPLEKIAFAQSIIIEKSKSLNVPVYVATNLMENMIEHSKPTRAEINDIVSTLEKDADGLVLAAETAIGAYPVECVRLMKSIIQEFHNAPFNKSLDYLFLIPSNNLITPHGGELV